MDASNPELLRKKYRYRKLIVTGRLILSRHGARRLIGPDCAYHLYARLAARRKARPIATRPGGQDRP